jgi:hypothetical protein
VQPDRTHDNMTHARSRNHYCRGKAGTITFEECVYVCVSLDLVMQHAMHMRFIIRDLSDCTIIFALSDKRHDFLEKVVEHILCVLIFTTTFV